MLRGAVDGIVDLMPGHGLSVQERAVLDFERTWWASSADGTKAQAIRRRLSISSTRYYRLLDLLCDSRAALDYDPLVVRRLRRRRTERRRALFFGTQAPRRDGSR
ncbi:MAG: hypothetical protein JWM85_1257 [Acidimicrobiaceae bacterium]|nr:hypothetical protein [Acidimicrobiaceae bacterium]